MCEISREVRKEHWIIWYVAKVWEKVDRETARDREASVEGIPLTALDKILFVLNREFLDRFGKKLLDLDFVLWHAGPYSHKLEDIIEESVDLGIVEYEIVVKVPDAPFDVDPEYAAVIIDHQLSEVEAPRKYVKIRVIPVKERINMPRDLEELLRSVNMTLDEFEQFVEQKVREIHKVYKKGFKELDKYIGEKYKLVDKKYGDIVA